MDSRQVGDMARPVRDLEELENVAILDQLTRDHTRLMGRLFRRIRSLPGGRTCAGTYESIALHWGRMHQTCATELKPDAGWYDRYLQQLDREIYLAEWTVPGQWTADFLGDPSVDSFEQSAVGLWRAVVLHRVYLASVIRRLARDIKTPGPHSCRSIRLALLDHFVRTHKVAHRGQRLAHRARGRLFRLPS